VLDSIKARQDSTVQQDSKNKISQNLSMTLIPS